MVTDAELNGLFLEPVLHGRYPAHARAACCRGHRPGRRRPGTIGQPIDFLGVNYYAPVYFRGWRSG